CGYTTIQGTLPAAYPGSRLPAVHLHRYTTGTGCNTEVLPLSYRDTVPAVLHMLSPPRQGLANHPGKSYRREAWHHVFDGLKRLSFPRYPAALANSAPETERPMPRCRSLPYPATQRLVPRQPNYRR